MASGNYVALSAFCFSMTIGVLWEFFVFGMDQLLLKDLQKDFFIRQSATVSLDPYSTLLQIQNIEKTLIFTRER